LEFIIPQYIIAVCKPEAASAVEGTINVLWNNKFQY